MSLLCALAVIGTGHFALSILCNIASDYQLEGRRNGSLELQLASLAR